MRREDVIAKLKMTEPALRALGITSLYLFGSYARDQAALNSDIDVFIDPAPDADFSFTSYMGGFEALRNSVSASVDYGTRSGLHPLLREEIEREAIRIF